MAIKTSIKDGRGSNNEVKVTSRGQLVIAPLDFSSAYNATAGTANVAANFLSPLPSKRFVITGLTLKAGQSVSNVSDATVVIYEAAAPDTTTVSKNILTTAIVRGDLLVLNNLNIILTEGVWLNLKTDDDDIFGTVFGYYVDA